MPISLAVIFDHFLTSDIRDNVPCFIGPIDSSSAMLATPAYVTWPARDPDI
jgi:hypothetical protein